MTQRNNMISVLRVMAMLAIILSHLFSYFGIYEYGVLNVFIYVFFIISGYLYSSKKIDNKKAFIISRIKKILVPIWIWSFILSLVTALSGKIKLAISSFMVSLFNLHGLDYLFFGRHLLDQYQIGGLIHCWFITVIMLCYISLIYIKDSKLEEFIKKNQLLSIIIFVIIQIVLAMLLRIQIAGVLAFYLGYFSLSNSSENPKRSILYFAVSLLLGLARLYFHINADGSIFYDQIIQPYFNISAALLLTSVSIYFYGNVPMIEKKINCISNNIIFKWLENNSYYLYIVHFAFFYQPLNFLLSSNFGILVFLLLLCLLAQIVNYLANLISNNR